MYSYAHFLYETRTNYIAAITLLLTIKLMASSWKYASKILLIKGHVPNEGKTLIT